MTGVYLLKDKEEVVYVGASMDVKRRVNDHKYIAIKEFDSHVVIECDECLLDSTELSYIRLFNPKYNIRNKLDQSNTPDGYRVSSENTNMIRIDSDHHQKLRLSAFNKHTSIQSELDAILQKHFKEQ